MYTHGLILLIFLSQYCTAVESQCFGTTANGRIENAKQLPVKGDNFIIYNVLGNVLNRNYVHSKVYDSVINSYAKLAKSHPKIKYKYAETGWKNGGEFKPHKTHQNGLSVDFMVPVVNTQGQSVYFPTDLTTKFGYGIEFDKEGKYKKYTIDFEAIAAHLIALQKASIKLNFKILRVIFAPEFRAKLLLTSNGNYIQRNIPFMKNKAWIRHDEHYHVDFEILCKKYIN